MATRVRWCTRFRHDLVLVGCFGGGEEGSYCANTVPVTDFKLQLRIDIYRHHVGNNHSTCICMYGMWWWAREREKESKEQKESSYSIFLCSSIHPSPLSHLSFFLYIYIRYIFLLFV